MSVKHLLLIEPLGRKGEFLESISLLDCLRELGVELVSLCGGAGTCGRCIVKILDCEVSPLTANEVDLLGADEINEKYRLACQTFVLGDGKVYIPADSLTTPLRTQLEGLDVDLLPQPTCVSLDLNLPPPTLSDVRADAQRLVEELNTKHQKLCRCIDLTVLRVLSSAARQRKWRTSVVIRGDEIIALNTRGASLLGLAIDLGTTTIAGYLMDLEKAKTLAMKGVANPQCSFGEDVISRISYVTRTPGGDEKMQNIVLETIDKLAFDLCNDLTLDTNQIFEAVVVGNTAMHHLFLRLPVEQLALAPYIPNVANELEIKARELGLSLSPGAYIHLLPNIAGFIGSDHVAMLLATRVGKTGKTTLALDIGTNTEICLAHNGLLTSVSCPSGPAFEGAHIRHGMRAVNGAIEHVQWRGDHFEYQTIGGGAPSGICGTGVVDLVAQFSKSKMIDQRGRFINHPRLREKDGEIEFVIINETERSGLSAITFRQRDVEEVLLAKAAIQSGIQILLEEYELSPSDLEEVIIAGAFGSHIDISSGIDIGMLPKLPRDLFKQVGNAAGVGAKLALISLPERIEAREIAQNVKYIELAAMPRFAQIFAQSLMLPNQES